MWQPCADIDTLRRRAVILKDIRLFFAERDVLEVETPALSLATVTDEHLASFVTEFVGPGSAEGLPLYLQTSPEYAMKRLLAAGSGSIFQIGKAFRNEESGRYHNPEFTMLEWYRVGFDDVALMAEVDQLLQRVLGCEAGGYLSYREAFIEYVGFDPIAADLPTLRAPLAAKGMGELVAEESCADTLMQLIFSELIEPHIGQDKPCFVYHFPATQAALARINQCDPTVSERFEVYYRGIELANGFHELSDATEQLARFERDNLKRLAAGRPANDIDSRFIAALQHGLPDCAGVALGIDRLIMLATGVDAIDKVMAFDVSRA